MNSAPTSTRCVTYVQQSNGMKTSKSYRWPRLLGSLIAFILVCSVPTAMAAKGKEGKRAIKSLESTRLKQQKKDAEKAKKQKTRPVKRRSLLRRKDRVQEALDANIEEQIETLQMLIESADIEDPDLPKYLLTLGDVYWDKSDNFYEQAYDLTLEREIYEASERGDVQAEDSARMRQDDLLEKERKWRERAIQVYRSIETRFPAYNDLDMVFYYLGYQLLQVNRKKSASTYFRKILERFPSSRYVPDALYHIGDHYFDKSKFNVALQFYIKVEEFEDSAAYAMALHRQGWCYFNMGDYQKSLRTFIRVILHAQSEKGKLLPFRDELEREARQDSVRAYAVVGSPEQSLKFFARIAPGIKFLLAESLANMYFTEGDWDKSITVYRLLLKHWKDSPNRAKYLLGIAENGYHVGDKKMLVDSVRQVMKDFRSMTADLDARALKSVNERLEGLVKTAATVYHKEAEKYGHKDTIQHTTYLYEAYLALFPNAQDAYEVTWNLGVLNEDIGNWEEAAEIYEKVIKMNPDGPYAADAARAIMLAYYNVVENEQVDSKDSAELNLNPIPYPDRYQNAIKSARRFIRLAKGKDPEVSKAHVVLARIAYHFNHFDTATENLLIVLNQYPDDSLVPMAARMLLYCYDLQRDVDNLQIYADRFAANPKINQGEFAVFILKVRNQMSFKRCFKFERKKEYLKTAQCFEKYVQEFPDTELRARGFFYAAAAYNRAKMIKKALTTLGDLYNEMSEDPLAPTALYSIAEIYRSIALYEKSAKFYEMYAKNHPDHRYVKKALQFAYLFRKALQQHTRAVKVSALYRKMYPSDPNNPNLVVESGVLQQKAGRRSRAVRALTKALQRPPKGAGADFEFRARLELGKAYSGGNRGDRRRALTIFEKNVKRFEELPEDVRRKMPPSGIAAVAESHFMLGEVVLKNAAGIKIKGRAKDIKTLVKNKVLLIKQAEQIFDRVVSYGNRHWAIAGLSRIGHAYERLAEDLVKVKPRGLNYEQTMYFQQESEEKAEPIRQKAIEMYRTALKAAVANRWFNTYTQDALDALKRLDFTFPFLKEYVVPSAQVRLSGSIPMIGSLTEAEEGTLAAPEPDPNEEANP